MPENDKMKTKSSSLIRMEADLYYTAFVANHIESCGEAIKKSFKELGIANEDLNILNEYVDNNLLFYTCLNKAGDFLSALKKLDVYSRLSEESRKALENLKWICFCTISEQTCPVKKQAEQVKNRILNGGNE